VSIRGQNSFVSFVSFVVSVFFTLFSSCHLSLVTRGLGLIPIRDLNQPAPKAFGVVSGRAASAEVENCRLRVEGERMAGITPHVSCHSCVSWLKTLDPIR